MPTRKRSRFLTLGLVAALVLGPAITLTDLGEEGTASATTLPTVSCRTSGLSSVTNGYYENSNIKIEPVYAKQMYADFRAGYDAMYIGYRITNTSNQAKENLWIGLDTFGPAVSLSRALDGQQRIGTLSAGSSVTRFFLVKANSYTENIESHAVRIVNGVPGVGSELVACRADIDGVQRSIAAKANKVTAISASAPVLGQSMTITVSGTPGLVGSGTDSPDLQVMTLSPTNYSQWPTQSLTLTNVSLVMKGVQSVPSCEGIFEKGRADGNTSAKTVTFTNELILRDFKKCASNTKQSYTITYTFLVTGSLKSNPAITPVSDISSGTQIKYTGAYPSETTTVSFSSLTVPSAVSGAQVTKQYVATSAVVTGSRLSVDYTITATATENLTLDALWDIAPKDAIILEATFTDSSRTVSTSITPVNVGTSSAPEFRFVGPPFTVSSSRALVLTYRMSLPLETGTKVYENSAYGLFGSYVVGSGVNTVQGVDLSVSWDGTTITKVEPTTTSSGIPQVITFQPPTTLGQGLNITLEGVSDSGLPVSYSAGPSTTCIASEFDGVWTLTMVGPGTCSVTATQAGGNGFEPAYPVTRTITALDGQVITATSLALTDGITQGSVEVKSSRNLEVAVSNLTPDECSAVSSYNATTFITTVSVTARVSGGTCLLLATQPGTPTVGAAQELTIVVGIGNGQRVQVAGLPSASIVGTSPISTKPASLPANTTITSSSLVGSTGTSATKTMLTVSLTSLTPATCAILPPSLDADGNFLPELGADGVTTTGVRLLAPGECEIQADQDGYKDDGTLSLYAPASSVTYVFTILPNGSTPQTVTLNTPASKVYGDSSFTITASASSGLLLHFDGTPGVCEVGTPTLAAGVSSVSVIVLSAGECHITVSQPGNNTYQAATALTKSFSISKKALSVTGLSALTREYDGTTDLTVSGTPALSGVVPGDTPTDVSLGGSPRATSSSPAVGTYTVEVSGLELTGSKAATSYTLALVTVSAEITKRVITLRPNDQTIPAQSATPTTCQVSVSSGTLAEDDVLGTPICSFGTYSPTDANPGTFDITISSWSITGRKVDQSANYSATLAPGVLTSSTATIPIITEATDIEIVYGQTLKGRFSAPKARHNSADVPGTWTHTLSGKAVDDDDSTRLGVGTWTVTAQFTPSDRANYAPVSETRRVIVVARPVTYSYAVEHRLYDGSDSVGLSDFSLDPTSDTESGVISGDDVELLSPTTATASDPNVGEWAVTLTLPTLRGAKAENYQLIAAANKKVVISPRPLTLSIPTYTKLADEADPTFQINLTEGSLAPDETLKVAVGSPSVQVTDRRTPEQVGAFALEATGLTENGNYQVTKNPGTLYVARLAVETSGVTDPDTQVTTLDSRTVTCNCAGLKPESTATLTIYSTPTVVTTVTVQPDGTCPFETTGTIPTSVKDGSHTLELAGIFPNGDPAQITKPVALVTPPPGGTGGGGANDPDPLNGSGGDPLPDRDGPDGANNGGDNNRGGNTPGTSDRDRRDSPLDTPRLTEGPGVFSRGIPTLPVRPNTPGSSTNGQSTAEDTGQGLTRPGANGSQPGSTSGHSGGAPRDTIDVGNGIISLAGDVPGSTEEGSRTLGELASENIGGFQPGSGLRIEVIGSRTTARFLLSSIQGIDQAVIIAAIQQSYQTQNSEFAQLTNVTGTTAPLATLRWNVMDQREADEVFSFSRLSSPQPLSGLNPTPDMTWIQVTMEGQSYLPGSVVYLTVTSSPTVVRQGVVGDDGTITLDGALPLEALGPGEHRIRLVGTRVFDGIQVDDEGEVIIPDEVLASIQEFDMGTHATVIVRGTNDSGGTHTVKRIVPLDPVAPWWAVWLIVWTAFLMFVAKLRGKLARRSERVWASLLILGSSVPAIYFGWTSTVTVVMWWGLTAGISLSVALWLVPTLFSRDAQATARTRVHYS